MVGRHSKKELENNNNLHCFPVSAPLMSICPHNAEQALFVMLSLQPLMKAETKNNEGARNRHGKSSNTSSPTCNARFLGKRGSSSAPPRFVCEGAISISSYA